MTKIIGAKQVNGYVLAGGKSSRMGRDKGKMQFKGKPLIQHIIEQLRPSVARIVIVSNNPDYENFDMEIVPDKIKDLGPAGGIHTALSHTDTEFNFVVSCDMPCITSAAIRFMIQNAFQSQITLPVQSGLIEPLFGVYSKECLLKWEELILQGIFKMQELVLHFKLQKLDVEGNLLFNEHFFTNINTKADLAKADGFNYGN